jgi:hypothetical protein
MSSTMSSDDETWVNPYVSAVPGRGLQVGTGRSTGFNRAIPARHRRPQRDNIMGISKFPLEWPCLGKVSQN